MKHCHSFSQPQPSLTHRNTYISMATDKRIAGVQKEVIAKAYTRTWMVSKKQIYGIKKNTGRN